MWIDKQKIQMWTWREKTRNEIKEVYRRMMSNVPILQSNNSLQA